MSSSERPSIAGGASLQSRLTRLLLVGCGALLLLTGLVLNRFVERWMRADFDRSLAAQARALVSLTEQTEGVVEFDFVADLMPEFGDDEEEEDADDEGDDEEDEGNDAEADDEDAAYFQLWLDGDEVFERSPSLGTGDLSKHSERSRETRFLDISLPSGEPGRQVQVDFVPQVEAPDDEIDASGHDLNEPGVTGLDPTAESDYRVGTLVVARSVEALGERILIFRWTLTASGLLLLLLLAASIHLSVRSGLRPLRDVAGQVEAMDADRLDQTIDARPPAELEPLVERINDLLARLRAAFERERRFSSDVAHELRTPIAELRSLAEVGGRWPDDRIAVRQFFGDTRAIAEQMEQVVSQLLVVARTEAGIETVDVERIDLRSLMDRALHLHEAAAARRNLVLESEVPGHLWLDTDAAKLELVLHSVLGNATRYAPEGGRVGVVASLESGSLVLTVSNRCENLTEEDLPHLFERFWRKDDARAAPGSSGLGLALVRSLAELLGVGLDARLDDAGRGSRFCLDLRFPPGAAGETAESVAS